MSVEAPANVDMRSLEGNTIAGRYRLDKFIDEGAFGAVFRAEHIAYGVVMREVAIKIAKRPMTDVEARKTFRDALIMASVADKTSDAALREHFVVVHDAGRVPEGELLGGHPYVVMELVRGGTLKHALRAGPFPLTRAVQYFDQLLHAMSFMHSATRDEQNKDPILHRDLKPTNILVLRRANAPDLVKVTDFGLAIEVDSLLGWVESGGDLAYLAPESFSHNICSPQSDVYMLGLIFYEMLTGINPFCQVGRHLRGTDDGKRSELNRLHREARNLEKFEFLECHEEIRLQPWRSEVIRAALRPDMNTRPYRNACELFAAWKQEGSFKKTPVAHEEPWEKVRRLVGEAKQLFAVGSVELCDKLLREALEINRNLVPNAMLVGSCILLAVERMVSWGQEEEAGKLAFESYRRRNCRSTCLALAHYYEVAKSPLAAQLQAEAARCKDQE